MANKSHTESEVSLTNVEERHWLVGFLILAAAITLVRVAVLFGQSFPLFFDEAQYWTWSQKLAFGYFSKPPFIAWIIAATTTLCGDGEACIRLSAPFFHLGTSVLIFVLGRDLYGARVGFWSGLTYIILPGVSFSAILISTDVYLLFFWALALVCLVRALNTNRPAWWIGLGIAMGFGALSKYAMAYFVLCLFFYGAWSGRRLGLHRQGGLWGALALACLLFSPNILWNSERGFLSFIHLGENINLGGELFNPIELIAFIGSQFAVFGPFLLLSLVYAGLALLHQTKDLDTDGDANRLLASFSLPILFLISGQAFLSRAHANWAAPAYVAATVWVCGWLFSCGREFWLRTSTALHILAGTLLYNYTLIVQLTGIPIVKLIDPLSRVRGWDGAGPWASALGAQFPRAKFLFDDRTTMAELTYYVRPHPHNAVMWNPRRTMNNHYEMSTNMTDHIGGDFIYIIRHDWPGYADWAFRNSRPLSIFSISDYPGHSLELRAYLLSGFQGYIE